MLPALEGRIDRKTYIIGNLVALGVLGAFAALIVLPLAILDLAINQHAIQEVINVLYYAVIFPAILYYFYISVLMIKRAHDIGWPGLLIVIGFTLSLAIGRKFDLYQLNLLAFLIIGLFSVMPGQKSRNNFGPAPRKRFRFDHLKLRF